MFWPLKKKDSDSGSLALGRDIKSDLDALLKRCKKNIESFDEEPIKKAFYFCVEAHADKERKSGSPYYTHPVSVALIVAEEIPLDNTSIVCALLHDVPENSQVYSVEDVKSEFGYTVSEIVEAISKIKHIENAKSEFSESYRSLLLTLFKDVRIILIKIAEMVHDMRTIEYLLPHSQKRLAREALEIFSPFAHRFGLGSVKGELEDLAFKTLYPDIYNEFREKIQLSRDEREEYLREFIKPINERLENDALFRKNKIRYEIKGRAKHLYSIYNKTIARNLPVEELNDILAIRIIVDADDISYCYLVYAMISDIYDIIPGTFKNYIANPKKNGYQSLHVAVKGKEEQKVEVQIRTRQMHVVSEKGIASHFKYKRGFLPAQSILEDQNLEDWMNLVRTVFEKIGEGTSDDLLENVRKNWRQDWIYAVTPANEFKVLPKNATPVDFAYAIHTEIGDRCIGAKVNGKIVPLDYTLDSGDKVEILTSLKQEPKKEWLKFAVSSKAKNNIQKFVKDRNLKDEERGKEIWDNITEKLDVKLSGKNFNKLLSFLNYDDENEFFKALSASGFKQDYIFRQIKEIIEDFFESSSSKNGKKNDDKTSINGKSKISGSNVKFAECCSPLPGDDIVGSLSDDGKTISIHRRDCPQIKNPVGNGKALLETDWANFSQNKYNAKVRIIGNDEPSIINEITYTITQMKPLEIKGFNFDAGDEGFVGVLTVRLSNRSELDKVFSALKQIKGVNLVERYLQKHS